MSYEAVCRTALATPGLLNIIGMAHRESLDKTLKTACTRPTDSMDKPQTHCRDSLYKAEIKSVKKAEAPRDTVEEAQRQWGHGQDK